MGVSRLSLHKTPPAPPRYRQALFYVGPVGHVGPFLKKTCRFRSGKPKFSLEEVAYMPSGAYMPNGAYMKKGQTVLRWRGGRRRVDAV